MEEALRLGSTPGFDWEVALDRARRLWVHPLLSRSVLSPSSPLSSLPPPPVAEALHLSAFAARIRWASSLRAMEPVVQRWDEAGIQVTLLKGAALQATLFPSGTRMLNDIDLWVPPERMSEAASSLLAEGFTRSPIDLALGEAQQLRLSAWTFHKQQEGAPAPVTVDLHGRLFDESFPFRLDGAACGAAGSEVPFAGSRARVFNREDAVVLAACHVMKEMVVKLQTVADLAALVGPGPDGRGADLDAVSARALEAGAAGPTSLALRWARVAGARVPEGRIRDLEAACPGARRATAVFLDARAVVPGFRVRAVAKHALRVGYRPSTGREDTSALAATVSGIQGNRPPLGSGKWWSEAALWLKSAPLTAACLGIAGTSAALSKRGACGWAGRVNHLLWRGSAWADLR
jgi:hypothetical protein